MKIIGLIFFALLARGTSQEAGVVAQADTSEHKPCVDLNASPASDEDNAAFKAILDALHVDMDILLYVSHDPMLKNYGGAMSFQCKVDNHELYETDENWTIYDPEMIQGDAARDFVFAHEIAHHLHGDTTSGQPRSKQLELRADFSGTKYLLLMSWTKARILHALDLLNLSQDPPPGYPTPEERKATVENAAEPIRPAAPTDLTATVVFNASPSYKVAWDELLDLKYDGPIRLQPAGTNDKYVCAAGTPDRTIPSIRHFDFFDNCERSARTSFVLQISSQSNSGYWIMQNEEPCPEYAANCRYALESAGDQLRFWNQDLAADQYGWEKELGEQDTFSFEAAGPSLGLVRIKARKGGYLFVDPKTLKLQNGGNEKQAAEFRVLFEPE